MRASGSLDGSAGPIGMLLMGMPSVGMAVHFNLKLDRVQDQQLHIGMGRSVGTAGAGLAAGAERLVHDLLDGTGTAAALRAAAEASIDLTRRARRLRAAAGSAHILVGQYVAGTNDHGEGTLAGLDTLLII